MSFNVGGSFTLDQIKYLDQISNDKVNEQKKKSQILDKDAFLKLMLTQLQHQNPLDPMDNTEYIAQMAQFSSVEQLANIAKFSEENNQLNALISTQIEDLTLLMSKAQTGAVDSNKLIEQNKLILDELMQLNKMLGAYFDKPEENEETIDASMMAMLDA